MHMGPSLALACMKNTRYPENSVQPALMSW